MTFLKVTLQTIRHFLVFIVIYLFFIITLNNISALLQLIFFCVKIVSINSTMTCNGNKSLLHQRTTVAPGLRGLLLALFSGLSKDIQFGGVLREEIEQDLDLQFVHVVLLLEGFESSVQADGIVQLRFTMSLHPETVSKPQLPAAQIQPHRPEVVEVLVDHRTGAVATHCPRWNGLRLKSPIEDWHPREILEAISVNQSKMEAISYRQAKAGINWKILPCHHKQCLVIISKSIYL